MGHILVEIVLYGMVWYCAVLHSFVLCTFSSFSSFSTVFNYDLELRLFFSCLVFLEAR